MQILQNEVNTVNLIALRVAQKTVVLRSKQPLRIANRAGGGFVFLKCCKIYVCLVGRKAIRRS